MAKNMSWFPTRTCRISLRERLSKPYGFSAVRTTRGPLRPPSARACSRARLHVSQGGPPNPALTRCGNPKSLHLLIAHISPATIQKNVYRTMPRCESAMASRENWKSPWRLRPEKACRINLCLPKLLAEASSWARSLCWTLAHCHSKSAIVVTLSSGGSACFQNGQVPGFRRSNIMAWNSWDCISNATRSLACTLSLKLLRVRTSWDQEIALEPTKCPGRRGGWRWRQRNNLLVWNLPTCGSSRPGHGFDSTYLRVGHAAVCTCGLAAVLAQLRMASSNDLWVHARCLQACQAFAQCWSADHYSYLQRPEVWVPDRMLQSDQPSAIFSNPTENPCIWAPRRKALASCRPNVTGALCRTLPICELIKRDRYAAGSVVGPLPLCAEIRNPPLWWSDSWPWSTSFMRAL